MPRHYLSPSLPTTHTHTHTVATISHHADIYNFDDTVRQLAPRLTAVGLKCGWADAYPFLVLGIALQIAGGVLLFFGAEEIAAALLSVFLVLVRVPFHKPCVSVCTCNGGVECGVECGVGCGYGVGMW